MLMPPEPPRHALADGPADGAKAAWLALSARHRMSRCVIPASSMTAIGRELPDRADASASAVPAVGVKR